MRSLSWGFGKNYGYGCSLIKFGLYFKTGIMLFNDLVTDSQAKPCSLFSSGKKRIEHSLFRILAHPLAVILHLDTNRLPILHCDEYHLASGRGCIDTVFQQIE